MRIDNDPKLDFDDVLIRPKRSEAPSRSAIIGDEQRPATTGMNGCRKQVAHALNNVDNG